jgi:hypothetical protein
MVIAIATSSFVISQNHIGTEASNRIQSVTSLRAHRQGTDIALSWAASGCNAARFQVERSYDGEYFEAIGSVDNIGARSYKFKDENPGAGYLYYRICCIDGNEIEMERSAIEVIRIVQRK